MKNNPLKLKIHGNDNPDSIKTYKENSLKTVYIIDFEKIDNGRMECYELFPGIQLTLIEVHAFKFDEFGINHCRKGRFECYFNGKYQYMGEGDLVAVTESAKDQYFGFPLGFYEGIEIFIDVKKAKDSLKDILGYSFDLNELYNKIAENNYFSLIKATKEIEHIFDEMYNVDEKIKETYFKLKLLKLFLFLNITPLNNNSDNRSQVSKNRCK
ncbi:hypothetical protein ALNOE001_20390 [Candidatus Methanobinarius endosymbioticus]|uniref:AraC-type arabinose-binding/dimerisation domain-containing protein n=1 Tax=Candidatus Methanobinarius endosymbioticus TaxID=2006182 RepID=A0A366M9T3_9EURY|nr:hypothetical protein ALNOE001_20390 [Candidatus Methanobinarius endosymbioticus]